MQSVRHASSALQSAATAKDFGAIGTGLASKDTFFREAAQLKTFARPDLRYNQNGIFSKPDFFPVFSLFDN